MGARGIGHIALLCGIAPPDVAAVVNVGTAHIGEFGSREAIARAKGEIVEALGEEGTAVLNAGDPLVAAMASRTVRHGRDLRHRWRPARHRGLHRRPRPALLRPAVAGERCDACTSAQLGPAPDRERAGGGRHGARRRDRRRRRRRRADRRAPAVAVADGAARSRRRLGGHQRRLQRQPRVDGRRPVCPAGHPRAGRAGARSRCSARCSSSATGGWQRTARSAWPLPQQGSTCSSPSARWRPTWRPRPRTRVRGRVRRLSRRGVPRQSHGCDRMCRLEMSSW